MDLSYYTTTDESPEEFLDSDKSARTVFESIVN